MTWDIETLSMMDIDGINHDKPSIHSYPQWQRYAQLKPRSSSNHHAPTLVPQRMLGDGSSAIQPTVRDPLLVCR